jgi:predicted nucleic acid-binding protein
MPYLDSNVFLYAILYSAESQPKAKEAKEILHKIENGLLPAVTSALTWDEVVWIVTKTIGRNDGIAQGQKLLGFPNLEFVNVDESILAEAQRLMNIYGLTPRDSIHVASALSRRIRDIISDDEDFDQVRELKRVPLK